MERLRTYSMWIAAAVQGKKLTGIVGPKQIALLAFLGNFRRCAGQPAAEPAIKFEISWSLLLYVFIAMLMATVLLTHALCSARRAIRELTPVEPEPTEPDVEWELLSEPPETEPTPPEPAPAEIVLRRSSCRTCRPEGHWVVDHPPRYVPPEPPAQEEQAEEPPAPPQTTRERGGRADWTRLVVAELGFRAHAARPRGAKIAAGMPPITRSMATQLVPVATAVGVKCPRCVETTQQFSTAGSNQFYLRLKCGRCGMLLARPHVV